MHILCDSNKSINVRIVFALGGFYIWHSQNILKDSWTGKLLHLQSVDLQFLGQMSQHAQLITCAVEHSKAGPVVD